MFITVHEPGPKREQRCIQVAHIIDYFASGSGTRICYDDDRLLDIRETPAEVMAMVKKAQRERDRMTIAAQFLSAAAVHMSERPDDFPDSTPKDYARWSVEAAEGLLAALDKQEGK
jgi:hypothetical protein